MKNFKIIELMELFDEDEVTTADQMDRPQKALDREMFQDANKRFNQADGGRIGFAYGPPRKIYKVARPITEIDRKQNPDIPKNAKFKMQVPAGKFRGSDSSTMMIYDTSEEKLNKRLQKIEENKYVKPSKEKKPIPDDKFFVKKSSKRIKENINEIEYEEVLGKRNQPDTFKPTGKTITKYKPFIGPDKVTIPGQGADTLKEAEKFVKDYFKTNPKKIRIKDPTKDYTSKEVRKKALKETDTTGAAGTKKFQYHHIRQIAGGVPLTTDDVMIINQRINSALGTKYNKPLNAISAAIQKNNKLALEAMNAKNEGAALDYMKRVDELNESAEKIVNSAINKLPKKYKGYVGFNQFTLPRNEYGLPIGNEPMIVRKVGGMPVSKDAVDLTTLNLKQEKEFKKIVKAQAERGQTGPIKNIEKLLASFSANPKCRANFSRGGRIGYATGPASLSECALSGRNRLEKVIKTGVKLGNQEGILAKQILRAGKSLGSAFTLSGLFGPAALAFTAAAEAGIVGYDMLTTGKTFRETIGDSLFNYALGEKTKIDPQEELFKRFSGLGYNDEQIGKFANVLNQTNTLNTILKQDLKVGNLEDQVKAFRKQPRDQFMLPDDEMLQTDQAVRTEQALKDEQKNLENLLINYRSQPPVGLNMEDTILGDMASGKFQETQQDLKAANIFADLQKEQTARDNFGRFFRGARSEQARADRIAGLEQDYLNLLQERGPEFTPFAGGGIAKLAGIDEGPQTVSMNPDSQGLQSLKNRVKNI